jgi:heat shock protein HtpX
MFFNWIKTALLLAALSALFLLLGALFGGQTGLQIAFFIALVINALAYFFSDKLVLMMYGAQPLDEQRYQSVYACVEELTHVMNLPMPKLWFIDSPMANAFATGRSPRHASVAVTAGILHRLDEGELRGVLSHELAHVKNRDILIATLAATIAAAIGYLAHMMQHIAFFSSWNNDNERQRGNNPLAMILISLLMPLAAALIQLSISRSREYLADETGARYSQDPLALASALEKLHASTEHTFHEDANDPRTATTASLFIVHPFSGKGLINLFSTHPPVERRIARLRSMCEKRF